MGLGCTPPGLWLEGERNEPHKDTHVPGASHGPTFLDWPGARRAGGSARCPDVYGAYELRHLLVVRQDRLADVRGSGSAGGPGGPACSSRTSWGSCWLSSAASWCFRASLGQAS